MAITYGIIGTGWITDAWITAAKKAGTWQLHCVYSRKLQQAQQFGAKHDCSKTYTSLDDMAADAGMAAVYIASPNNLHHAHARQMLRAGKHVILEKPATSTVAELDELFAVARERGVVLIEAYRHLQEANFKLLERLVREEKRLGPIYGASLTYASYSSRYDAVLAGETPNIFSLDFSGGSLVDIGVYPVAFAVALFGEPESQTYVPFVCGTGVDGGGVVVLRYGEFGVQINQSKVYTSTAPSEIYGERGTLAVNGTADIATLTHWHPQTKRTEQLAGEKKEHMMEEEAAEFARIIEHRDSAAAARLEEISRGVIKVTTALRHENKLRYPADKTG